MRVDGGAVGGACCFQHATNHEQRICKTSEIAMTVYSASLVSDGLSSHGGRWCRGPDKFSGD
ncbi:hypothetical protein M8C21_024894 [Ambrosia artemisiifolia]|uniref:Uncharacterized protein n=1 Tax=Ambrosia artemisiifolia TaxID=4212 RepID=A0AAD5GIT1_AMBAR|nr:hypothetical protein M8C21_024894 [Ambrosia artemisiifolia]